MAVHRGFGHAGAGDDSVAFGGAIGIALIGSILSAGYASGVESATAGLPAEAAAVVKDGIGGAYALAPSLGARGPAVLASARTAFVDGWKLSMWISAALAIATASVTAVWIPRHRRVELPAVAETTADARQLVAVD